MHNYETCAKCGKPKYQNEITTDGDICECFQSVYKIAFDKAVNEARQDEREQFAEKLEIYLNCDYSNTNGLFNLRKDLENWLKELKLNQLKPENNT